MGKLAELAGLIAGARMVDLSHVLEEDIPIFAGHSRFYKMLWNSPQKGDKATNYQFIMNEHNGTHVDAPCHFIPGAATIDQVSPLRYCGPCAVLDVEAVGEGGVVEPEHILEWEKTHGELAKGEVALFNYGWAKRWKKMPDHLPFVTKWPGIGLAAAELLCRRGVTLVGSDTLGIDSTGTTGNPAHNTFLGNGVVIAENLNNLPELPPRGAYFLCLPLSIGGGTGSPVRPIALIP